MSYFGNASGSREKKTESNNNNEDSIMNAWLPARLPAKECICEHIA